MLNEQNVNYPGTAHPPRQKLPVWVLFAGIFVAGLAVSGLVYYFATYWPPSTLQKIEPGFVYLRASSTSGQVNAEVVFSNNDGSIKRTIQTIPNYIAEEYPSKNHDVAEDRGLIVYKVVQEKTPGIAEASLWVSDRGKKPEKILVLPEDRFFQDVIISADGEQVAYSLIHQEEDIPPELWTVKPDGKENKMIIERLEKTYGANFKLIDFTEDEKGVFLQLDDPDVDISSEIFVADLETKRINPFINIDELLLSQGMETDSIEAFSFSPDRTKIAFSIVSSEVSSEPFSEENDYIYQENAIIYIHDLNTKTTRPLYPASVGVSDYDYVFIGDLSWSNSGKILLYLMEAFTQEIKIIDVRSNNSEPITLVKAPVETTDTFIIPLGWASEDRVVYIEDRPIVPNSSEFRTNLYTVKTDGSDKKLIDSTAANLGVFESFILLGSFKEKEG